VKLILALALLLSAVCPVSGALVASTATPPPVLTAEPTLTLPAPAVMCIVTADRLNVRPSPSADKAAVAWLSKGDVVEITGRNGEWLEIVAGWINAKYCEVKP